MNVLHSIVLGYVFTAAIFMGQAISASSSQSGDSLSDNFIGFDSAPDKVVDGSVVRVRYQCSRQCQLAVEVVVSTLRKTDLMVFRRKWINSVPRVYRFHQVRLRFPLSILYQHSFFNRRVLEAQNVTVRAWLDHLHNGNEPRTYHSSIVRIYKVLQIMPLSERPTKPPTECPSWSAQLMWQMTRNRIHQCPHESDVIDMLKFPLASTGEHFGMVRRFQPFIDRALEKARLHAVTQPRFQDHIHYDDTDGYFVIGGGKYMPGIRGYFGPIKYYRFGTEEGHIYSLIGASGDNRFALMHAGYKHTQGIDGFPKDLDMAYSYYSNAGAQSDIDSSRIHEDKRCLGAMLYWGQHGVSKDTASAVKWFERSAMQMKDPSAMYDYSILLMKGQGVKRNYTRGFQLLEKAAAMGSINALNGLGWYHGIILNDHKTAVKYFEQAALNGSDDGMFNLGIYHLNGKNPDSPWRNETAAFQQFLNASQLGHVAAAVEAAWYLSTGSLEGVSQDAERAVMQEAFVKYVLAAETGLGLAQSNVAHLCEELNLSHDCQRRYHNYSILNYSPHPSALLKMGDYYYYSSSTQKEDSLSLVGRAISMYSRAALAGSPQGMYNLVILAQQGHVLPLIVHGLFNVAHHDEQEIVVEKILERCVNIEGEDAVTPCSLALLRVQMGKALRKMSQNGAQLLLVSIRQSTHM
eukprot:superscaffoldBa00000196_g2608